jgi:hypothetical protein
MRRLEGHSGTGGNSWGKAQHGGVVVRNVWLWIEVKVPLNMEGNFSDLYHIIWVIEREIHE